MASGTRHQTKASTGELELGGDTQQGIASTLATILQRLDTLDGLSTSVKKIENDVHSIRETDIKQIKDTMASMTTSIDHANKTAEDSMTKAVSNEKEISHLKWELEKALSDNAKLKEKMLKTEAQERRNNLVLEGIKEAAAGQDENCDAIVHKILKVDMNLGNDAQNIQLDRCHRLGKRGTRPRGIIFRVHSYTDREKIWKARDKINGHGNSSVIKIHEDYPAEIQQRRRYLQPSMVAAIQEGKRATLSYDKLVIEGVAYTVDTAHTLPVSLRPEELAVKRGQGFTAFFSAHSPLSNFAMSTFTGADGHTYSSVEKYFQYHKALYNDDIETAQRIRKTDDPAECKYLGSKVELTSDPRKWSHDIAYSVMYDACTAKFLQNPRMKEFLLSTKDDVLIEANPKDCLWGVGLSLKNPNILSPAAWKGKNELGKLLRQVRDDLDG